MVKHKSTPKNIVSRRNNIIFKNMQDLLRGHANKLHYGSWLSMFHTSFGLLNEQQKGIPVEKINLDILQGRNNQHVNFQHIKSKVEFAQNSEQVCTVKSRILCQVDSGPTPPTLIKIFTISKLDNSDVYLKLSTRKFISQFAHHHCN